MGWQIVSLVTSSIKLPNGEGLEVSFWNLVHNVIQGFYHGTYTYIQIYSIVGFFGSHGDCFSHSMVCIICYRCVFHWYPGVLEVLQIYVNTRMKICSCWHACVSYLLILLDAPLLILIADCWIVPTCWKCHFDVVCT